LLICLIDSIEKKRKEKKREYGISVVEEGELDRGTGRAVEEYVYMLLAWQRKRGGGEAG